MDLRFKLLDCTLRDGGYINNWNFGYKTIRSIIQKLVETEVDYIEIGFLRNCIYDENATLFNNIAEAKRVLPSKCGNSKFTLMALHNLYDISKLEDYDGTIEAIRVTFHNYDIDEGLQFVKRAMEKGYKVFCNPINIMGYSDAELLQLIDKVNQIHPYAFSIVDTFGSMMKNDLLRIYSLVEHNLNNSIRLGLHLHENLGLSYSLAQNFIEMCSAGREAVIDGSLFGMGRVPGNLNIELIMDYMNRYQGRNYNLNPAYDAINDYIEDFKSIEAWGYSTAYALSAKYNLHRNYSEYLLSKGTLHSKDINLILAKIEEGKKAAYDKAYIEELYKEYQNVAYDDQEDKQKLTQYINERKILILAPGYSLKSHKELIENFISQEKPCIISTNYDDQEFGASLNFYTNLRRYDQYVQDDNNKSVIVTSNLIENAPQASLKFNYYSLACDESGFCDNCTIMLLRLLESIDVKEVYLAGFDGFSDNGNNYAYEKHYTGRRKSQQANKIIAEQMMRLSHKIKLHLLTPSRYLTYGNME